MYHSKLNIFCVIFLGSHRFLNKLEETVKWSDILGYVYWFAVLTTISCGCATGIYVTRTNKSAMVTSCQEKYEFYENFIKINGINIEQPPWIIGDDENKINGSIFTRQTLRGHHEIGDLAWRIGYLEQIMR